MRPRYLLTTIGFVTVFTVILVMLAAGFIPLNTVAKIHSQSGVRDVPEGSVVDQVDTAAFISSTTEPLASPVTALQDGPALLENHCSQCHTPQQLSKIKKSHTEWENTLAQMETKGVHLSVNEKVVLLDYLAVADKP